jgi:glycosyltransferase involved in cell wall biosynthesis
MPAFFCSIASNRNTRKSRLVYLRDVDDHLAARGILMARVVAIIPALNEEESIGLVLDAIPPGRVDAVIVADNGSADRTADVAREGGATVVFESERGYGAACLRALEAARELAPEVVVFLDADFADDPRELPSLVDPILLGQCDLVIGSRTLGRADRRADRGALTPHARFGNWLATTLIRRRWGVRYTDLGPFRAVRWTSLERMQMRDRNFGWTVEMQIKAARLGLRVLEVPVSYRARIGESKISGTIVGSFKAGAKILWTIFLTR